MAGYLADKPIGFLYSKKGNRAKLAHRKRPTVGYPSPEDIAAGLSDAQQQALIEVRPDNVRGRHSISIDHPVPDWRGALIVLRGRDRPFLTSEGEKVRRVLLAQVDRNPEGHDAQRHGAKHESPVRASECAPKPSRKDSQ